MTDIREINNFSSLMLMRKLADDPKASFITDFKLLNEKFTNWVNQRQISIPDHIYPTELGLQFNEKGAIEVIPVGKPSNQWNLSLWLKYSKPNFRQAILSHEDFEITTQGAGISIILIISYVSTLFTNHIIMTREIFQI